MEQTEHYKHRNCTIVNIPTEKFPHMVQVISTPKTREVFQDRRYITIDKAVEAIETWESEKLIKSKEKYIRKELEKVIPIDPTLLMLRTVGLG